MVDTYNLNNIKKGKPSYSGHVGYPRAQYCPPENPDQSFNIIYKENKHGNPHFSVLEAAFSQLASLFLGKNQTPFQKLVVNDNHEIEGLAVQHMCYVIDNQNKHANPKYFKLTKPRMECGMKWAGVNAAEHIPVYFMDKLPHEFFNALLQAEKENRLKIDYESLAAVFTASYTLEEDDLHKGNFGFYLVERHGKPTAVFFKIDHDLMFVDSIMSFVSTRFFHWAQGANAFVITANDLKNLPYLGDSSNLYWPTRKSILPTVVNDKEYCSDLEVQSFAKLADVPEFIKAKWTNFYKHILIPTELIQENLRQCLDINNPVDRAEMALLTEALVARQARLRAVLFSIQEFRDFVGKLTPEEERQLLNQASESDAGHAVPIKNDMDRYRHLCCDEHGFEPRDTPLHVAIKLGDYRYEETFKSFGEFVNYRNHSGKRPIDCAKDLALSQKECPKDVRQDARFTIKHLLQNGSFVNKSLAQFNNQESIETYTFKTEYLQRIKRASDYQSLKQILRDVGEDSRFCLKYKKNLAIECIHQFIVTNTTNSGIKSILRELKKDINGDSSPEDAAPLKYIRQLRSNLWIIRQIRGQYGLTSTQWAIDEMINKELSRSNSHFFRVSHPEHSLVPASENPLLLA